MQLLFHLPDDLATRFKAHVPARQRSEYIARLLEAALPVEDDPLYQIALAVEQDEALNAEMREWREALVGDGARDAAMPEGGDAAR